MYNYIWPKSDGPKIRFYIILMVVLQPPTNKEKTKWETCRNFSFERKVYVAN